MNITGKLLLANSVKATVNTYFRLFITLSINLYSFEHRSYSTRIQLRSASFEIICRLLVSSTVRDNLLPMSPNLGQHPPFFLKMTFFKNRPPWYQFYRNSVVYHGGRFLTHPKTKKVFFPLGILGQIGRCR